MKLSRIACRAAVVLAAGCASDPPSSPPKDAATPSTTIEIAVLSGRPQPPPATSSVRVGSAVVLRLSGLGPPSAIVVGPDGSAISTADAPLRKDGSTVGVEHRFTPSKRGAYRVEYPPGSVLAIVDAT